MAAVADIRTAIAAALTVIPDVQVSAYVLAAPTPPGLQILPPGVDYHQAFQSGVEEWAFTVQGFVALNNDVGAQVVLDGMCATTGPLSVKAAVESDVSLGGVVENVTVMSQSPGRVAEPTPGNRLLLVEWTLRIYT